MKNFFKKINFKAVKVVAKKFGLALGVGLGIGLVCIGLIKAFGLLAAAVMLFGLSIGLNLFVSYLDEVEEIEQAEMMDAWLEEVSEKNCEDCNCDENTEIPPVQ